MLWSNCSLLPLHWHVDEHTHPHTALRQHVGCVAAVFMCVLFGSDLNMDSGLPCDVTFCWSFYFNFIVFRKMPFFSVSFQINTFLYSSVLKSFQINTGTGLLWKIQISKVVRKERIGLEEKASFRSFQSHSWSWSKFPQHPETRPDWLLKGEIKTTVNFWPRRSRREKRPSLYQERLSPSSFSALPSYPFSILHLLPCSSFYSLFVCHLVLFCSLSFLPPFSLVFIHSLSLSLSLLMNLCLACI